MNLIVGLGNPGYKYTLTRHNVGFLVIDKFLENKNVKKEINEKTFIGYVIEYCNKKASIIKPMTYMNLSGKAVEDAFERFDTTVEEMLVVYDDVDLEVGKIRLRARGTSGGHKGMASILHALGTEDVPRLRIGIGRGEEEITRYVLSNFEENEIPIMTDAIDIAAKAIEMFLRDGISKAMTLYNKTVDGVPEGKVL